MAPNRNQDAEDADAIIARSIDALKLADISGGSIGSVLLARAIFTWRQEGWTDDEILSEVASGIAVPLGRNRPPKGGRGRRQKGPKL